MFDTDSALIRHLFDIIQLLSLRNDTKSKGFGTIDDQRKVASVYTARRRHNAPTPEWRPELMKAGRFRPTKASPGRRSGPFFVANSSFHDGEEYRSSTGASE